MPLKQSGRSSNIQGLLLVLAIAAGLAVLLTREAPPGFEFSLPQGGVTPSPDGPSWQEVLQQQFVENSTPLPQVEMPPTQAFQPPTLVPIEEALQLALQPTELLGTALPTNTPLPPPPSPAPPDLAANAGGGGVEVVNVAGAETQWQPPPLQEPLSYDPRDHFWLARPIDSNAINYGLFYYSYGSDGPDDLWRVHHGIDMPNPIGEQIRAAGPGIVLWAADGFRVELPDGTITETTYSYGNTVLIKHDFGYRGEPLYTLYAHLSAVLVTRGQRVETGDVIGLVGDTGIVTGSHVHFEVRVGDNSWYSTRNPLLWMVPYTGHGVIAGRVIGPDGNVLGDQDISIIDRATGRVVQTTASYVEADTNRDGISDVTPDDVWQENFAAGDIPEGRYRVVTRIDGVQVVQIVDVFEGTTAFVELKLPEDATPLAPTEAPAQAPAS